MSEAHPPYERLPRGSMALFVTVCSSGTVPSGGTDTLLNHVSATHVTRAYEQRLLVVTLLGCHPVPWVTLTSWSLYLSLWSAVVPGMCHQASLRWHHLPNDEAALRASVFLHLIEAP